MKPSPLLCFAFSAIATLASAAQVQPGNNSGQEVAPWPSGWPLDMHSMELADIDSDGATDGIVHEGDRLVIFPILEISTGPFAMSSGGLDVDDVNHYTIVFDEDEFDEVANGIAVVRSNGLEVYRWAGTDFALDFSVGGSWAGAKVLRFVDWDGDGLKDLVGLSSSGKAVLVHLRKPNGLWYAGPTVTLPGAVDEIVPLQWDAADAELEVATTHSGAIEIFDGDGTSLYVRGSPFAPGSIARIQDTTATDDVAWYVGPDVFGNSYLLLIGPGGTLEVTAFPGLDATVVTGFDDNGDGKTDLTLTFSNSWEVLYLQHQGGAPAYNLGSGLWLSVDPPLFPIGVNGYTVGAAGGDVNDNGYLDIAIPSKTHAGIVIVHGTFTANVHVSDRSFTPGSTSICYDALTGDARLTVEMIYEDPPTGSSTRFTAAVFIQQAGVEFMDEDSVSSCTYEFVPTSSGSAYTLTFLLPASTEIGNESSTWSADLRTFHIGIFPRVSNDRFIEEALSMAVTMDSNRLQDLAQFSSWPDPDLFSSNMAKCSGGNLNGTIAGGGAFETSRMAAIANGAMLNVGWDNNCQ